MKLLTMSTNLLKKIVIGSLISFSGLILAGESVDKSLTSEADGIVEIHNVRGDIKIIGWSENRVKITGELDDLTEKLIFENDGKVTIIRVQMPERNINRGDGSDLIIHVPKGNRVDFNGISTDVWVENVAGGVDLRSISGDVELIKVSKLLFVNTVSGDLKIKDSSGKARLDSVSGDIKGKFDSQDITANSVSGDVKLVLKEFETLTATSVSGDVIINGQLLDSGETTLSSVSGDISLDCDNVINARVSVKAGPGGDITNNMSNDNIKDIFPNQQKLSMTLGDGSGRIKIGTISGSVDLNSSN